MRYFHGHGIVQQVLVPQPRGRCAVRTEFCNQAAADDPAIHGAEPPAAPMQSWVKVVRHGGNAAERHRAGITILQRPEKALANTPLGRRRRSASGYSCMGPATDYRWWS
jgi:hypothetical protein